MKLTKLIVSVDTVIFRYHDGTIYTPLYRREARGRDPYAGHWSLPGGPINTEEDFETACHRKLQEDLGLTVEYLEQLYTFGAPDRDPRGRAISVSYMALIKLSENQLNSDNDESKVRWFALNDVPKSKWAFDHASILATAIKRLKAKVTYEPIGINLLDQEFSIPELQTLYESILERQLDRRNFAKKIHSFDLLISTRQKRSEGRGRPTQLFRFNMKRYKQLTKDGFIFEL
ncbi:MAG: NUDIX domain-containing protein [Verrucomicrobiota bacterium]